jgi:hypothetical protein
MRSLKPRGSFGAPAGAARSGARWGALEVHHVVKRAQGARTSISTGWWRSVRRAMPKRMPPTRAAGSS